MDLVETIIDHTIKRPSINPKQFSKLEQQFFALAVSQAEISTIGQNGLQAMIKCEVIAN